MLIWKPDHIFIMSYTYKSTFLRFKPKYHRFHQDTKAKHILTVTSSSENHMACMKYFKVVFYYHTQTLSKVKKKKTQQNL